MADQEGVRPAGCGYGLLGLCCVCCLRGPCRRSPFDDAGNEGFCGEDNDWIVAYNIMQRVVLESLQAMAAFRNALEQASDTESRIEAWRLEEMRIFLSPFSRDGNRFLEAFYSKAAFPSLHALGDPKGSWMTELLDAAAGRPPATRDPEAIMADALRLSAGVLSRTWVSCRGHRFGRGHRNHA